jgi:hypothetical protein
MDEFPGHAGVTVVVDAGLGYNVDRTAGANHRRADPE